MRGNSLTANFKKCLRALYITYVSLFTLPIFLANPAFAEDVCLGLLVGSQSILASEAKQVTNGVELAVKEIAANTNSKYNFAIQKKETSLQSNKAIESLNELTQSSNPCRFIIGPQSTNEVIKLAPLAKQKEVLLLTATARSDDLAYLNNYVFRLRHTQKQESDVLAAYIKSQIGKSPLYTIVMDSYAGYAFARNFKESFIKIGGKFGFFEDLYVDNPNYPQIVDKLLKLKASHVLAIGLPVQVADLMLETARVGLNVKFYGTADNHNEIIIKRAGELSEGFTFTYSFDPESNSDSAKFASSYKAAFGEEATYAAANSYDAVMALSTCLERVGNEVGAVKSCLFYIRDFPGAGGYLTINRDGSAKRNLFIKTIQNGRITKLN